MTRKQPFLPPPKIKKFIASTFTKCMPKTKQRAIAREHPKPALKALKVLKADKDITGILDKEFPTRIDKTMSRVQTAILVAPAPLISLWMQLESQGFSGKLDELILTKEVFRTIRDSLALIGNASSYMSTQWRQTIIQSIHKSRPRLADFL